MQAMLGPFPMTPFQSGKYFSSFKKFVGHISSVPGSPVEHRTQLLLTLCSSWSSPTMCCFTGSSKNVVNILKKLRSTDYIFADFLARLLVFDPGEWNYAWSVNYVSPYPKWCCNFVVFCSGSRLTPAEAACHPFLASECAFGFMLPRGYFTQGVFSSN